MRHPFLNFKSLSLYEPQAWTVIAALQVLIALAGWMTGQGLATVGGMIGAATAIAGRWFVTHPLIEYVEVGPEDSAPEQETLAESQSDLHASR